MKALVGALNQEKALVGAFSVIVQPVVEPMEHCTALEDTQYFYMYFFQIPLNNWSVDSAQSKIFVCPSDTHSQCLFSQCFIAFKDGVHIDSSLGPN